MSSITTKQAKLDLELVPKEKRLEIGKCNGRLNPGKTQREPTFQVILDALALTPFRMDKKKKFYLNLETFRDIFQICPRVHGQDFDELPTDEGMYYKKNVDYVELLWEDFTYQIDNRGYKKQEKMYYPRFTKVIIYYFLTKDKIVSRRNKIGMHTSRDDYLINTLRFFSANEESQIYGARLPESMTITPPKKARKFKKHASPKLTTIPVSPEEPTKKSKRVKRPAKKSTNAPTTSVVIRDNHVMSLSKKKEKMTVEKRKGIELLSEVALTKKAQYEEVRKKSLRDFHKTDPSGSGIVTNIAPSAAKIKPSITNEGTGAKPGVPDVNEEESTESEAESWGRDEDDINNDHDSSSEGSDQESDSDETNVESKVEDNVEGDEDKGIYYTTNQFDDDVDARLNKPVNADEGFIQNEGTDAEMINVQQGNENLEITLNQVIEDAYVTISTILVTSSSHSSDLASKFLKFLDIPHTDVEIVSPMDVHVHHEVPRNQTPTLLRVPVSVITESSPVYTTIILQSLPSFTPPSPQSTPTTTEATNPLSALPNFASEVSNFAPSMIKIMVIESLEHAVLAKESSQPQSTYEAAASLTEFESKKILIDKIDESQSYLTATEHRECYDGLIKSYDLNKSLFSTYDKSVHTEKLEFEIADSDMPQDQEENLGNDDEEPKRKTLQQGPTQSWLMTLASSADKPSKNFDELMSTPIDFSAYIMNGLKITNLTQETLLGPAFKLLKGTRTNFAELEYDFEECYKALLEKLDWDNPEGGDFPRLCINNIEDMLILDVHNRLTNLSGDDVFDFAITLQMFTRSMVIQKRVEDLQLGVENYQKKINVTKPETTRPDIKKRDPYTPYQDPQGFIYVDNQGRNRLMRSDELYKFSDGTLIRL
ncbi:hypothetical protein Tco_0414602 [Tanacetum coccineum]